MKLFGTLLRRVIAWSFLPVLVFAARFGGKPGNCLIWGCVPILNNKYWSNAMKAAGWQSETLMSEVYSINARADFDRYFIDTLPPWIPSARLRNVISPYCAFLHVLKWAKVLHVPFSGGALSVTPLWRWEARLLRWRGVKTVVIPYGADAYLYSTIADMSLRHALLASYPGAARIEDEIGERVRYWNRHADIIISGFMVDGLGRWDALVGNMIAIDLDLWKPKTYPPNATVKILHAPNHRGFKGTEFLLRAVEELQAEGLPVELVLLERVPNTRVREVMQEVDILAEQFVATGYGLNAIEGMASGLPVLSNLDSEFYSRVFRRYAFLNECPILSTTPETLKDNLRLLITNLALREALGRAGRAYAEKYHSYAAAQYLFGAIYDKLLHGKEVDLINLFHPLKSPYNRSRPLIAHPLIENHLPADSPFRVPAESRSTP